MMHIVIIYMSSGNCLNLEYGTKQDAMTCLQSLNDALKTGALVAALKDFYSKEVNEYLVCRHIIRFRYEERKQ